MLLSNSLIFAEDDYNVMIIIINEDRKEKRIIGKWSKNKTMIIMLITIITETG